MRALLCAVTLTACSSTPPAAEATHGPAATQPAAPRASPPPAPLLNGALYSVPLVAPFDIQRPYDSARRVAIWNDGTVVVLERPDTGKSQTQRLLVVTDYGRATNVAFTTDERLVILDGEGRRAAVLEDRYEPVETVDVASGKTAKMARGGNAPGWLKRFENPMTGLSPTLVGTSASGAWAVWSYIGALVAHTYVLSPAGRVDLEQSPPRRVAIGDDGIAMFFSEQDTFDRTSTTFLATTYDLSTAKRGEPFVPLSTLTDARPDVGAYTAAPLSTGFAVGYADGHVRLMDRTMSSVTTTFETDSPVVALGVSQDGKQLASVHADGRLYVWPLAR